MKIRCDIHFSRRLITIIFIVVGLTFVSACQSNNQSKVLINDKIVLIKLKCIQLCEDWEDKPFLDREYSDKTSIDIYTNAIRDSKPMEGALDYGAEFEMNIYYKDQSTQGYHLSLTNSKGYSGLLVALSDTAQGYSIEVKDADQIRDLIWK